MIKKAFIEEVNTEQNLLDIFREELIAKYGENIGNELNENFKKMSELSDLLLDLERKEEIDGVNGKGKQIRNQVGREIRDTLFSMVNSVLVMQDDLNKKIDKYFIIQGALLLIVTILLTIIAFNK